ncbi:DoxX family protein [Microbispora triticiradicis]|uniref:DoxX family protein n=1 Tax=Microbispora TaxID=2005 RepID=UPI001FCC2C7A|nr:MULTISPECIES: DoxX family protein [Microbispora]GLW24799.1 integral membrane protein [Microbispora amethystogenes]
MKIGQISGPVLSLFRVVTGLLFVCHGVSSIFGVLGGIDGKGQVLPTGSWPGWWGAAIQLVFGTLVLLGLFTRVSAVLCSGSMAYAYFTVHAPQDLFPLLNGGEAAAMFCWSFFLIAVFGPGSWALDTLIHRMRRRDVEAYAPAAA